ncbi:hypothetical protein J6590_092303, partial [Homalodisca vitripennis]
GNEYTNLGRRHYHLTHQDAIMVGLKAADAEDDSHMLGVCESLTTSFNHYEVQGEAPSDKLYTSATLRPQ